MTLIPGKAVSVVVPTYNRSRYIEECINSVFEQTVPPFEVIVIDDGSTDDTADKLRKYGDRIRYFYKPNGGKSAALNFAIPHVNGDYLWFFDDDDVALPNSIEDRLRYLESHPDVAFVSTGHYLGSDGENGRIRQTRRYELPNVAAESFFFELMKGCYFTLQSVLVRRGPCIDVGKFDEALVAGEDYDFMLRLAGKFQGAVLSLPTFIFRQHTGARGPKGRRYSADKRHVVFQDFERTVGRKLRSATALGCYLVPRRNDALDSLEIRYALLRRMWIMASKGLIVEMIEDLRAALAESSEVRLSTAECQVCTASVCTGYADRAIDQNRKWFMAQTKWIAELPGGREVLRMIALGFFRLAKSFPGNMSWRLKWLSASLHVHWTSLNRRPFRRGSVRSKADTVDS